MATYMMPNTIRATARNAEVQAHQTGRNENNPLAWLGKDSSWEERRLFDWTYLSCEWKRGMEMRDQEPDMVGLSSYGKWREYTVRAIDYAKAMADWYAAQIVGVMPPRPADLKSDEA